MPRARLGDIAGAAGVSVATVDRVLNRRPGVRAATAEKVWTAVERLGAHGVRRTGSAGAATLDVLVPAGAGPPIDEILRGALDMLSASLGVGVRVRSLERNNPQALADALETCADGASDGVAIVLPLEHALVRDAVEQVAAAGVPVVTVLSDISAASRVGYSGMDNRAAGRTAGYLMGRFLRGLSGHVAILSGTPMYRSHEEREIGFRGLLREEFPDLHVLDRAVGMDDPDANHAVALQLLEEIPDLQGLYNMGSGNRGVVQALRERGRVRDVTFVAHNLTSRTRSHLLEGAVDAVIHPDMERIAEAAMLMLLGQRAGGGPEQRLAPFEIVVRESLPG